MHGVSFTAEPGAVTCLIGTNGAGKTTTLRGVLGLQNPRSGRVVLRGADVSRAPAHRIGRRGVALVPEGRRVYPSLSVRDNLRMGAVSRTRAWRSIRTDPVLDLFPELAPKLDDPAGVLSGGAAADARDRPGADGRALAARPRRALDGPVAQARGADLRRARGAARAGRTILLSEQNARLALELADDAVVLATGTVALRGPAAKVRDAPELREVYLGG